MHIMPKNGNPKLEMEVTDIGPKTVKEHNHLHMHEQPKMGRNNLRIHEDIQKAQINRISFADSIFICMDMHGQYKYRETFGFSIYITWTIMQVYA